MNTCCSEEILNRYLEDTLTDKELTDLEHHIGHCSACREEFEKWERLKEILLESSMVEVPDTLKEGIMERVRQEKILYESQPLSFKRKLTAVCLSLLAVLYYIFPFLKPWTSMVTDEVFRIISVMGYNLINITGLDIATLFAVFKAFISLFNELSAAFALGAAMLVVGFFTLAYGRSSKLKAN